MTALVLTLALVGCRPDSEPTAADTAPEVTERVSPAPAPVVLPVVEPVQPPAPTVVTPVTYEEAEAAWNERDYVRATELFTRYIDQKPENPWGHYMLGLSARKAGELEIAELAFRETLMLDDTHVKSWQNLARTLLDGGRSDDALSVLIEADSLSPENGINHRLRGRALHQAGELISAADAYREAILINESDAWAINNLALVLVDDKRYEQALTALAQAVSIAPDNATFQNNLGMALELRGFFRAAELAYGRAVDLNIDYERAQSNLDRVVAVEGIDPSEISIETLAQAFIDEVNTWRDEYVARELGPAPELTDVDS